MSRAGHVHGHKSDNAFFVYTYIKRSSSTRFFACKFYAWSVVPLQQHRKPRLCVNHIAQDLHLRDALYITCYNQMFGRSCTGFMSGVVVFRHTRRTIHDGRTTGHAARVPPPTAHALRVVRDLCWQTRAWGACRPAWRPLACLPTPTFSPPELIVERVMARVAWEAVGAEGQLVNCPHHNTPMRADDRCRSDMVTRSAAAAPPPPSMVYGPGCPPSCEVVVGVLSF